jgi:hypothetical protein
MFAFRAKEKTIQALVLTHGRDAIEATGKHFVDIALMAHVKDEAVAGRFENAVQRNGQLNHAEVGTKVTACLRKDFYQLVAHFLGELRQILFAQRFDIRGRANAIQQARIRYWLYYLRRG